MSIRKKQSIFAHRVALLILHADALGYEVTLGHAMRCQDCPVGIPNSNHKIRLAIDLNLFRDGEYLTKTEDYAPLGEYWKSIGGSWGGDFDDGNHFSFAHSGVV
jgi:hypothetical protein